jgi:hypothetical protein
LAALRDLGRQGALQGAIMAHMIWRT